MDQHTQTYTDKWWHSCREIIVSASITFGSALFFETSLTHSYNIFSAILQLVCFIFRLKICPRFVHLQRILLYTDFFCTQAKVIMVIKIFKVRLHRSFVFSSVFLQCLYLGSSEEVWMLLKRSISNVCRHNFHNYMASR